MKKKLLSLLTLLTIIQINCIEKELLHQITSTSTIPFEFNAFYSEFYYKPELILDIYRFENKLLDAEISYDINLKYQYVNDSSFDLSSKLYRGWLRYSNTRTEFRVGLQKINFGPARVLRSLQWFDNIDPFDPTKTTEGVKALLNRTYFHNNANLWLWGIWGRSDETSLEQFFTDEDLPEIGGRIQFPFTICEAALTYHWKENANTQGIENRLGLDARWDLEIGFWIETYISKFTEAQNNFHRSITLGADYTIPWGNGLYILAEYLQFSQMADEFFKETSNAHNTAISLSYPFNIFENLSSIILIDLNENELYSSFTYQYTMNYLSIYVNLFLNSQNNSPNIFNENKLQVILRWNY